MPLFLASLQGCTPRARPFLDLAIYGTAIALDAMAASRREPERVVIIHDGPYAPPPPALPAGDPPPERPRVRFDAAKARVALHDIDLAPCRDRGAPRGYFHARITFLPEGNVREVVIDDPPGLPAEAVKCIGDRLAAAKVPPFDVGEEMVTRGHWFVP